MSDTRFQNGNMAALKHGRYSQRVAAGRLPEQADAVAALDERVSAIVSDLGGLDALSAIAHDEVRRYARLELVAAFLWRVLETTGPLTGKGRTRAALTAYLAVDDRLHRRAMALGLARRPRPVPSLDEWIDSLPDVRSDQAPSDQAPPSEPTTGDTDDQLTTPEANS